MTGNTKKNEKLADRSTVPFSLFCTLCPAPSARGANARSSAPSKMYCMPDGAADLHIDECLHMVDVCDEMQAARSFVCMAGNVLRRVHGQRLLLQLSHSSVHPFPLFLLTSHKDFYQAVHKRPFRKLSRCVSSEQAVLLRSVAFVDAFP